MKEPSREGGGVLLVVLFGAYLVLLAWVVLWKLQLPYVGEGALRQVKVVPFVASGGLGASAPLEVVANLLLFVPFGLYLGLLAPRWEWWRVAAVIAGASLVLEVVQYVLAIGSSDVTDLVVNTAGGVAGIALLAWVRSMFQDRTAAVMTRICLVGTVFALVAVILIVTSSLRYGPPRGAAVAALISVSGVL